MPTPGMFSSLITGSDGPMTCSLCAREGPAPQGLFYTETQDHGGDGSDPDGAPAGGGAGPVCFSAGTYLDRCCEPSVAGMNSVPAVSNLSTIADTTAPAFASAATAGTSLVITFYENLAAAASLANSAFTVKKTPSGGTEATVTLSTTVVPVISGKTVTLGTALVDTDGSVKVSYTKPTTGTANKLVDATVNKTASFTDQTVTTSTTWPTQREAPGHNEECRLHQPRRTAGTESTKKGANMVIAEPPQAPKEAANSDLEASWYLLTSPGRLTRGERLDRLLSVIPSADDIPRPFTFEGRTCLAFAGGAYGLEFARARDQGPAAGR